MPAYKDKSGKWIAKFQYKDWTGKTRTKFKRGFDKKKDAQEFERHFLTEHAATPDITLGTLYDRFLEAKGGELKENTVMAYRVVRNAIEPLSKKRASAVTPIDILNFRTEMAKTRKASTVNQYINKISNVYRFGMDMFDLKKNPCSSLGSLVIERTERDFMTIEDVEKLKSIDGVTEETKLLIDILFWTGMRISEAIALQKSDIHDTYLSVFQHKVRTPDGYVIQKGVKNNRGRNVAIHKTLHDEIVAYADRLYDRSQLFEHHYTSYALRLRRLFRLSGLNATVHTFRHSHVAMLIHMGYSPKIIADRIGDTVETMLKVYAHIYPEDIAQLTSDLETICSKRVSPTA